jgi:hypothetical protein
MGARRDGAIREGGLRAPACRDDGSVSFIDTRHVRLWPMCNIEHSANETNL